MLGYQTQKSSRNQLSDDCQIVLILVGLFHMTNPTYLPEPTQILKIMIKNCLTCVFWASAGGSERVEKSQELFYA